MIHLRIDKIKEKWTGENIIIHQKLTFAERFTELAFRRIFYPVTVQEYVKRYANPDSPYAAKIFDLAGQDPAGAQETYKIVKEETVRDDIKWQSKNLNPNLFRFRGKGGFDQIRLAIYCD